MIVGAVLARQQIDHRESVAKGPLRLVCVPEVASACQALANEFVAVTIDEPATTAARLSSVVAEVTGGVDAWVVPAPWPTTVDAARRRGGLPPLFDSATPPLARSPIQFVAWTDRASALATQCRRARPGASVDGRCLGDVAGLSWPSVGGNAGWGKVKIGIGDPVATGSGSAMLGAMVKSYYGRTNVSRGDLDSDDAFAVWFDRLISSTKARATTDAPLARMLSQGPSASDIVVATEADITAILSANPTRANQVRIIGTDSVVSLLVARIRGSTHRLDAAQLKTLTDAVRALDWRIDGNRPAGASSSAPADLPAGSGLPSDGLLDALTQRWKVTS